MDIAIIILFLLVGVALLIAEIFLLPGITIAGVAGGLFIAGGIVYAFMVEPTYGFYAIGFSVVAMVAGIYYFMKSKTLDKLSLHAEIDSKVEPFNGNSIKVGDRGITTSRLAPIGKIKINNIVVEAKSTYEFIDENVEVEVTAVNNTNVDVVMV